MLSKLLNKYCKDSFFTKVWNNKKFNSLIKLVLWIIIMTLLYVLIILPNQNVIIPKNENISEKSITFDDMKEDLLKYNFDFKYTYNLDNEKSIYYGTFYNDEALIYLENSEGLSKYYLKNGQVYLLNLDNLLESDIILPKYFDLKDLFSLLVMENMQIIDGNFVFAISDIYVKILAKDNVIYQIEIKENDNNILLEFSNVNQKEKIDY